MSEKLSSLATETAIESVGRDLVKGISFVLSALSSLSNNVTQLKDNQVGFTDLYKSLDRVCIVEKVKPVITTN